MKNIITIISLFWVHLLCSQSTNTYPIEYLDSLIQEKMKEFNVPGSVVSIIKDDSIIYNRGYGYADIESNRKVDPINTTFRVASISKPFTAIAILQLIEKGKISIDQDLRPIFSEDFNIDYPSAINLKHILTHTTGWDHSNIGSHKGQAGEETDFINKYYQDLPEMVLPPGTNYRYSNIAFGFLGYLIEKLSGLTYSEYMERHVLRPLDMNNSTFANILETDFSEDRASTYRIEDKNFIKQNRQALNSPAASSLETTGHDMAKFMMAIIHPDSLVSKGVLSIASANAMFSPQYNPGNLTNSIGFSIAIGNIKNRTSFWHSGGVNGFLSVMEVIPEEGLGVFVAQNNRYGSEPFGWVVKGAIQDTFMTEIQVDFTYLENDPINVPISKFAGFYKGKNYNRSTIEKAELIVSGANIEREVKVIDERHISIDGKKWKRLSNSVFGDPEGLREYTAGFKIDEDGNVNQLVLAWGSALQYTRIHWIERTMYLQILIGSTLLLFLGFLIHSFIKRKGTDRKGLAKKTHQWRLIMTSSYFIGFIALLVANMIVETLKFGLPLAFKVPIVFLSLIAVLVLFAPISIGESILSKRSVLAKLWEVLLAIAIIWLTYIYASYNIIGLD